MKLAPDSGRGSDSEKQVSPGRAGKRGLLLSETLYANEHLWGRLEGDRGYLEHPCMPALVSPRSR